MSDQEVRRPRRIIPAQPAPQGAGAISAAPRQVERFQRVLQQGRRIDVSPARALQPDTAQRSDTTAPCDAGAVQRGSEAPPSTAPSAHRPTRPVQATASTGMDWGLQPGSSGVSRARDGSGFSLGHQAEGWDTELVRVIVTLCINTDPAIEAWSVVVPLNERVLPQTELHLTLSRHTLSLRFHTQAPQSMRLLSVHRSSLAAMMQQALPGDREIDIDLT